MVADMRMTSKKFWMNSEYLRSITKKSVFLSLSWISSTITWDMLIKLASSLRTYTPSVQNKRTAYGRGSTRNEPINQLKTKFFASFCLWQTRYNGHLVATLNSSLIYTEGSGSFYHTQSHHELWWSDCFETMFRISSLKLKNVSDC